MAVNVLGTWHVLLAAEAAGIAKVVHFSSAQVFGIAEAERAPDFFPVDDEHPRRAMRAADICATEPSLDAAARLAPGVPIKDPARYQVDPRRALIDCFAAATRAAGPASGTTPDAFPRKRPYARLRPRNRRNPHGHRLDHD